jgi:hypothetical protein
MLLGLVWIGLVGLEPSAVAQPAASPAKPGATAPQLPNCRFGEPIAALTSGTPANTQLVAKVCLHKNGDQRLIRHSVELRAAQTGARLQQASLPATPTTTDALPAPALVLPGSPPLLVLPHGIAAADLRLGSAELVFEAQGKLLGAARDGDLLTLVEEAPAGDDRGGAPQLEWTVLDLEAGQVIGQAVLAGAAVDSVVLRRDKSGVYTELRLRGPKKSLILRAGILGPDGKSLVKNGQLAVQVSAPGAAR